MLTKIASNTFLNFIHIYLGILSVKSKCKLYQDFYCLVYKNYKAKNKTLLRLATIIFIGFSHVKPRTLASLRYVNQLKNIFIHQNIYHLNKNPFAAKLNIYTLMGRMYDLIEQIQKKRKFFDQYTQLK